MNKLKLAAAIALTLLGLCMPGLGDKHERDPGLDKAEVKK